MSTMKPCYIFDIDGTIANGDHRLHHITTEGQPKNWDAYFDACGDDEPIEHMADLAQKLYAGGATILYVSGRNERCREATLTWLERHYFPRTPSNRIYMRALTDFRADDIVKIELLAQIRVDGYEPLMAFDDRNRVVKAWREAGIPCAQVAEGDF
jgi:phosphoglycolate phosphatase-like HAD superfamily hydrolase